MRHPYATKYSLVKLDMKYAIPGIETTEASNKIGFLYLGRVFIHILLLAFTVCYALKYWTILHMFIKTPAVCTRPPIFHSLGTRLPIHPLPMSVQLKFYANCFLKQVLQLVLEHDLGKVNFCTRGDMDKCRLYAA